MLGYLYGSCISTAIFALGMAVFDWRLAVAAFWGVPVAFGLLFGLHGHTSRASVEARQANLHVTEGLQEMLENAREIRATNQEARYLEGLGAKVDAAERATSLGEVKVGLSVNAASVIMRLGVATTILTGASLILAGQLDFMAFFMFLLAIGRICAPFDQALALIAEVFVSEVSADRLNQIMHEPVASGTTDFAPQGYDIVFENVGFVYQDERVLDGVSFVAHSLRHRHSAQQRQPVREERANQTPAGSPL